MNGRRVLLAWAGAAAIALVAAGSSAQGGAAGATQAAEADALAKAPPTIRIRVSTSKAGPFKKFVQASMGQGARRTIHWRVTNTGGQDSSVRLDDDGTFYDDFKVRWFRGDLDISDDVKGFEGFSFTSKPGKARLFSMRVRRTPISGAGACMRGRVVTEPAMNTDRAVLGINAGPAVCT